MPLMPPFLPFVRHWFEQTFAGATAAQRDGWEAIASGRDTLIVAPTGSGKTLAAFLWALDHLHRLGLDGRLDDAVRVVYVSPLRALNNDIEKNLRSPLAGLRAAAEAAGLAPPEVRVAVRTSDTLPAARRAMVRRPPHVLITTPESLFILLTSEGFRPALAATRFVIVDEVHALMPTKRGAHLALSLERLQALVEAAGGPRPQRIGCSATVHPVGEALRFLTGTGAHPATVVDAGFARDLDIEVVSPVDDFLTASSETVWDAALQQITELVQAHRTTLVFAQSRRAAERLARDLDDRLEGGVVAAHHGSLSRRARLEAEHRLKRGELRALVATSSLELGIDVGAIDLVVQLQSPRTVAAGLQRIGRAGHVLQRVSKGRIVVTKGEELVEAAALVRAVHRRRLDRMAMPRGPLDVLAQQIVATVAVESTTVDALLALVRRAAPYAELTRDDFVAALRAVAEPLPREVKGVAPRVLWDRVNDRLHARRGSRLLALTSGGTIPDAGLFDVYVADTDLKVGTLDEEFVTESLPGDVFLLGSHPWRIARVRADRVLVEDAGGMSPTVPFWKGEHPSRSYDLGLAVGELRREAAARLDSADFEAWAAQECGLSRPAAAALRGWLGKARELLGGVPDEETLVVESFADEMGGRHAMLHSVFGMRVNGAWGMALREALRRRFGLIAEASHVDDGILLSFAPGQVPPAPGRLVRLVAPEEVDGLLGRALIGSPLFTSRFRHAAVRALFIPRMVRGQRTPAWLQRLRADALMESVGGVADFPVVAETLRECFNDALDVPALKGILQRVHAGHLPARDVDTPLPSPFVYPLLAAWDWAYLDAGHAEERRSDAVSVRRAWSATAGSLQPDVVAGVEAELQRAVDGRRARDANELAALLEDLGDLTTAEVAARCEGAPEGLLAALLRERRVLCVPLGPARQAWIGAAEEGLYRTLATADSLERVVVRATRTRGVVTAASLAERYGAPAAAVAAILDRLAVQGLLRSGTFLAGGSAALAERPERADKAGPQFMHIAVLEEVQRRHAVARGARHPRVPAEQFAAFLLRWQHVHPDHRLIGPPGLLTVLGQLQGEDFAPRFWEQALLALRVDGYEREWLDRLGLAGEVVWTTFARSRSGRIGAALRENLGWLRPPATAPEDLEEHAKAVLRHLQVRGAAFVQDVARAAGLDASRAHATLLDLFWVGLAAPDTFTAIEKAEGRSAPPGTAAAAWPSARSGRSRRRGEGHRPVDALPAVGRWSALGDEDALSADERDEARVRLLLSRYGVVTRELAGAGWGRLRGALLRMEYGGEVARGYFVEGLGGEQYALEEALADLAAPSRRDACAVLVNLGDPASLWGTVLPLTQADGTRIAVGRAGSHWLVVRHGRPLLLARDHGLALTSLGSASAEDVAAAARELVSLVQRPPALRPVPRLRVESFDDRPVAETPAAHALLAAGFARDGAALVLEAAHGR